MGSLRVNSGALDVWSLVHAVWGGACVALHIPPWLFVGLSMGYEVFEYWHETPHGSALFGSKAPESPTNVVGDLAVEFVAYLVARAVADRVQA